MPGRMVAERDGAIGWMIFDHPERRNAVTQGMWLQIGEILEDFGKDEAIRVVALKGECDKAFVSGADISQFGQQRRNAAEVAESNRLTDAARKALETFAKPTICTGLRGHDRCQRATHHLGGETGQYGTPQSGGRTRPLCGPT